MGTMSGCKAKWACGLFICWNGRMERWRNWVEDR